MKRKTSLVILLCSFILFLALSCLNPSMQQAPAPIPPDVTIVPPEASLPAEAKLLSGKWAGRWNSKWGWDCLLYVEKVGPDAAQVVQAWGEYNTSKGSCHCKPNWARVQQAKLKVQGGKASLEYVTPGFQTGNFKKKRHNLSGEDEGWVGRYTKSHGHYDFMFWVNTDDPKTMKGQFVSGKGSPLSIEMKKITQND